jgi:hypothetical protein
MCSCQKRNLAAVLQPPVPRSLGSSETWGPTLWKMLHITSFRIGQRTASDDEATRNHIQYIVDTLPRILPCPDCQDHARTYLAAHPFLPVGGRNELTTYVSNYLFEFHNAVRLHKGQPILIHTWEECRELYAHQLITLFDAQTLDTYLRLAVKYQVVRGEVYTQWNMRFRAIRNLLSLK